MALSLILTVSCKPESEFIINIKDRYEVVDGKKEVVEQVIQSLRKSDNKPVSRLTRIFNYDDDVRIEYATGLTKDDGLRDYLLDSIYYDSNANDTLKISYVHLDKWYKTQLTRKEFRPDNQVEYFRTERQIKGSFKMEIFYKYLSSGRLFSKTEFECSHLVACDSVFKTTFRYDSNGAVDSTMYTWHDNKWNDVGKKRTVMQ